MDVKKIEKIFRIVGFCLLAAFGASFIVDIILHVLNNANETALRIIEIIFGCTATLSLSVSISLSIKINKKQNQVGVGGDNNGGIVPVNADGSTVNVTINNGTDPDLKKELVDLSNRMDNIEKSNVEKIVEKVLDKLKDKETKPVDNGFVTKFLHDSKEISDKDIQDIWASLMVNNATNDDKVSKRTLDIVKNLSTSEANTFKAFAELTTDPGVMLKKHGDQLGFMDRSTMQDVGLLKNNDTLTYTLNVLPNNTVATVGGQYVALVRNSNNTPNTLKYDCYALTKEGLELKRALGITARLDIMKDLVKEMNAMKIDGIQVTLHKLIKMHEDGRCDFETLEIPLDDPDNSDDTGNIG